MVFVAQFVEEGMDLKFDVPELKAFKSRMDMENYLTEFGFGFHTKDLRGREYYEDISSDERAYVYELPETSIPS